MNGKEFVRRARRYARRTGQEFYFDSAHGKGSHSRVYVGQLFTTVPYGEIGPGLLASMLRDLDIDREEF